MTDKRTVKNPDAACGNRWKYGKDACARERGHIGPHRNTVALEAWSFSWFDSEGTPADEAEESGRSEPLDAATGALYAATLRAERTAEVARHLAESLTDAAEEARAAYESAFRTAEVERS
jgi:hypothetical protein